MKKYIFFLMIPIIFGCKEDLSGHWHANLIGDTTFSLSIDILENNDCYLYNSLSYKPIKGKHFPNDKHMFFPGQCGEFSFDYKLKDNKIYLESALGAKLIAERQVENCDRIKDYATLLKIDFLKIKNKRERYQPKDSIGHESFNENILLDTKDHKIRIEYFNKINSIDKIDSIITHIEDTHSDFEIPFINYVLTPDKNLKASDLKIVIDKLNEGYKKKIFIRTLKVKPEKMNIFEFIKIDKIQLNSDNKLFYIIN